jgi:7-cyano-7-deazaguanine synthase
MFEYKGSETHRVKDVVCIYSGGMDSFTLVNQTHQEGQLFSCLSFNYGQRHSKELVYARQECERLAVPHYIVDLTTLAPHLAASALMAESVDNIPQGHYAEESMKQTVVPNRNMIMLSIAIAHAVTNKLAEVRFGAHAGDHTIYPDCREEFVTAMDQLAQTANWHPVRITAPFQHTDKAGILGVGFALGLDYRNSWTCYEGRTLACGKCGSCQERLEAFRFQGRPDPLEYEV